ncbi:unnamed protein product [Tetraodon nigroviridis]|uniref:Chromosome 8 SCAF14545, whole genome shotgun sequence n=1 Tax=Tetraodon nigroviridis TaxID=99883 RepID=Q4SMP9_TETNG|nr:unnamed protein product [Tetraodon nigroviridis]
MEEVRGDGYHMTPSTVSYGGWNKGAKEIEKPGVRRGHRANRPHHPRSTESSRLPGKPSPTETSHDSIRVREEGLRDGPGMQLWPCPSWV